MKTFRGESRIGLLLSACATVALLTGPGAYAQSADDEAVEEILVTGSRIRRNPLEQPSPVINLSAADLDRTGLTSLADALQRLPSSGAAFNSRFNNSGNFGFPPDGGGVGAGAAQIDLRHLGSKRVLVLVDGQRWVSSASASGVSSAVDLNTIPTQIIERIEILEDGASTIYGSDAIAGVVNIITKKNFEGVEAEAYVGAWDEGDGETQEYSLSFGSSSARTRNFFSVGYVRQERISAGDRKFTAFAAPVGGCAVACSSGTPQSRIFFTNPNGGILDLTVNDGVTGVPRFDPLDPTGPNSDFHTFTTADRFNFQPFNLLVTPSKRINVFAKSEFDVTPEITLYVKALYNNRQSTNQAAPEPLFIGPQAGNGNLMDTIFVDVTNPFNPFPFSIGLNDPNFFSGRRPIEAGPRIFKQNVNTWQISGGLQGEFQMGDRPFYWDMNISWAQNRADQVKNGAFNSANLKLALGPLAACQANLQCVPFNFFGGQGSGGGTITQEMLDFVGFTQKDLSEQELVDFTANISGSLFDLPAGALGFAAGFEFRDQEGFFIPDSTVVAGNTAGIPAQPTQGGFDVTEWYAEVNIPLLRDAPMAELLEISLAARTFDYNTSGNDETFKLSGQWKPVSDLLIRGGFTEGFRAPGIGELFGSETRFDATMNDPCSDMLGLQGGQVKSASVVANCIALGVPADGSYAQFNPQISVTTGGNPNLNPETSDGFTIGAVYSPSWISSTGFADSLTAEITYFDIELDGAIQAIDAQVQLDQCVATLDSALCGAIGRTVTGSINRFANQLTNIGGIETSGIDLKFAWVSPETDFGQFRATWMNTFLINFDQIIPTSTGFTTISREGTENGDPEEAWAKWKGTFIMDWFYGDFTTSWTVRHSSSVTESCIGFLAFANSCSNPNVADDSLSTNSLSGRTYNDLQITYTPSRYEGAIGLTIGVNNLFDENPPACFSCALNNFDATTYDAPGQFGYVRLTIRQ